MSELRGLCNEIIIEQEFKVKAEKTEYALCYIEELKIRLQSLRATYISNKEEAEEAFQSSLNVSLDLMDIVHSNKEQFF